MSAVVDPGSARPGRIVGLVLIGIAVLAAVLGILSLIDGGDGGQAGPTTPPAQSSPPSAGPSSEAPPSGGPSSGTSGGTTAPPQTAPPQNGQPPATAAPPPANPPANPRAVPIRVYNNGTVTGLAAQAAADFRADGWTVVTVGNYSQGIIPTSTVYFRPGTEEEAAAQELGRKFNLRVEPRFPGIVDTSTGLIVIVTNDYGGK
jgi:hypothetical protein